MPQGPSKALQPSLFVRTRGIDTYLSKIAEMVDEYYAVLCLDACCLLEPSCVVSLLAW